MVADATTSHVPSEMDANPSSFGDFKILNQFLSKIVDCAGAKMQKFCGRMGASPIKLLVKTCLQDFRSRIWPKTALRIYPKCPIGCLPWVALQTSMMKRYEAKTLTDVQ